MSNKDIHFKLNKPANEKFDLENFCHQNFHSKIVQLFLDPNIN